MKKFMDVMVVMPNHLSLNIERGNTSINRIPSVDIEFGRGTNDSYNFNLSLLNPTRQLRTALVVLGMHRSGTSVLANVLSLSGFSPPKTLMKANKWNPNGYYESVAIMKFNDKMMKKALGSSWSSASCGSSVKKLDNVKLALKKYKQNAISLIKSEFQDKQNIVLKDPRISVLYDFWSDVLRACEYTPKPIIAIRNPLEVVASLARRNNFTANQTNDIWLHHSLAAERATRGAQRAFVLYDDLMDDFRTPLRHCEAALGVVLANLSQKEGNGAGSAVSPTARHARLASTTIEPAWLREVFEWFRDAARGGAGHDATLLDRVWAQRCARVA